MAKKKKDEEEVEKAFEGAEGLDEVEITVTEASMDPIPVYVNGAGMMNLRVGARCRCSRAVIDALEVSDVVYTVHEGGRK